MLIDDSRPRLACRVGVTLAFRVGVTGHRELDHKVCEQLRPRVRARLEQIKHLAEQAAAQAPGHYDDAPAILRAVSPLAQGADQVFAKEALDLGYELECPLPFHCRDYRNDFAGEANKKDFDELLGRASAVFELDGTREDADAAYTQVGDMVLDQCDMLLGIWDGKSAKGAGGTADIVAKAKRRIPVLWLHTDWHEPDTIFTPDRGGHAARITCEGIDKRLKDVVWRLLLPPLSPDPTGTLNAIERLLEPVLAGGWRVFERILTLGMTRSQRPTDAPRGLRATFAFQTQFATWDSLAKGLAGLYRGAFLSNYVLGVMAVFLALVGNAFFHRLWPICESVAISIVGILILCMRLRQWHLRTADCRYLAERFRILCYSYPLGFAPSKPHLPAHYLHAESSGWLDWHTLAIVRLTPMPTAELTPDYLEKHAETIRKWVRGQIHYHDRNAAKLERMDVRIHRLAWVSIGLAFLAALAAWLGHNRIAEKWHPWLLFFTAGLPAASAAAHAISTQGEFRRLVDRSESMARRLRSSLNDLNLSRPFTAANLRRHTEDLAQVLLEEVADWQILYRKPPPPPG
jgi:hypothetical protein